ncbi:MAG: ammonium transporter [Planctomycetota bacterium]|nr:ammonium transporter [Planctomycetota bacterium]
MSNAWRRRSFIFPAALGVLILGVGKLLAEGERAQPTPVDSGAVAWMLTSSAFVLLMTPGLALFYCGMVRSKNVLATLMHSFFCMALITVQWVVIGYSISFGVPVDAGGNPDPNTWCGGLAHWFLDDVSWNNGPLPDTVFMIFQMMFAIITPALITGAFAERVKFGSFVIFTLLWATLVYDPIAHWVWGDGGLLGAHMVGTEGLTAEQIAEQSNSWCVQMFGVGVLDFAGGTVVHISAGVSALVVVLLIGKRRGYPKEPMLPNNLVFTVLGASILWFGWFGFNGGSGIGSNALTANAFVVTHICAASAAVGWAICEWLHHTKVSILGVATGLVAGLVCITPASGFVSARSALLMGLIVAPVCYVFVTILKGKLGYDDSLDVFGVHGVGGTVGASLTGLLFDPEITTEATGNAAYSENAVAVGSQLGAQAMGIAVTGIYAAVATAIIVIVIDKTIGMRVSEEDETTGLDVSQHGETGYNV